MRRLANPIAPNQRRPISPDFAALIHEIERHGFDVAATHLPTREVPNIRGARAAWRDYPDYTPVLLPDEWT